VKQIGLRVAVSNLSLFPYVKCDWLIKGDGGFSKGLGK